MDGERIVLTSGNSLEPLCILAIVVLISADLDIGLVLLDAESVVDTKAKNDQSHQQGIHHRSPIFPSSPKWDESNLETQWNFTSSRAMVSALAVLSSGRTCSWWTLTPMSQFPRDAYLTISVGNSGNPIYYSAAKNILNEYSVSYSDYVWEYHVVLRVKYFDDIAITCCSRKCHRTSNTQTSISSMSRCRILFCRTVWTRQLPW